MTIYNYHCAFCGKPYATKGKRIRHCSHECSSLASRKGVTIQCKECKKDFYIPTYRIGEAEYCSLSCKARWELTKQRKMVNPNLKGNKFAQGSKPNSTAFKRGENKGELNATWKPSIVKSCLNCGGEIKRKPHEINRAKRHFCGTKCWWDYSRKNLSREKSPLWKGGYNGKRGKLWHEIRLVVVNEQNGDCAHCGKHVGASLPIHHIVPFRKFEKAEDANKRENLIGLCQSCHMKDERKIKD